MIFSIFLSGRPTPSVRLLGRCKPLADPLDLNEGCFLGNGLAWMPKSLHMCFCCFWCFERLSAVLTPQCILRVLLLSFNALYGHKSTQTSRKIFMGFFNIFGIPTQSNQINSPNACKKSPGSPTPSSTPTKNPQKVKNFKKPKKGQKTTQSSTTHQISPYYASWR